MSTSSSPVETSMFGTVTLEHESACAMDGGTHGCVGHTLRVDPDRMAHWERRLDSMGDPEDCSGAGSVALDEGAWGEWVALVSEAWEESEHPEPEPPSSVQPEVPRYVWALVMRRGDTVRVIEGPPFGDPWADPPAAAGRLLEWMRARVAEWCGAAR